VVARLDVPRAALRLSDDELGVAVMLMVAPDHPSLAEPASRAVLATLEEAGLVVDGRIEGFPARLLAVVAAPKLRVTVEMFVGVDTRVEQAWATEREGVMGTVAADGQIELSPVEPALLPWAIAREVGLGPRRMPERGAIAVPAEALGLAADRLAERDRDGAESALADLDGESAETLLALLTERRLSWRASSAWTELGGDRRVESVAVLDAGVEGLWLTRHEGDPDSPTIHLEPVPPSVVWDRVVDLMPQKDRA
jgi:EspG family